LFASGRIAPDAPYSGRLHAGPDADLIADLERLANDPASVAVLRAEPALAELVLPPLRADYRAVETYVFTPGERLRCPVSVMLGDTDPTVTIEQARDGGRTPTQSSRTRLFPDATSTSTTTANQSG
jgi:surfactin synthase thioesterase subunit